MYLEGSLTKKIFNPSENQIKEAFTIFENERSEEFLILSFNDLTYIQTAISDFQDEGFIIEYQEGSIDNHYITLNKNVPKDAVVEAFISYLNGTPFWKTGFEWEPLTLDEEDL